MHRIKYLYENKNLQTVTRHIQWTETCIEKIKREIKHFILTEFQQV